MLHWRVESARLHTIYPSQEEFLYVSLTFKLTGMISLPLRPFVRLNPQHGTAAFLLRRATLM